MQTASPSSTLSSSVSCTLSQPAYSLNHILRSVWGYSRVQLETCAVKLAEVSNAAAPIGVVKAFDTSRRLAVGHRLVQSLTLTHTHTCCADTVIA